MLAILSLSVRVFLMLIWQQNYRGLAVTGLGNQTLLSLPMTAFFASRQCPGVGIRLAMDWAIQQAQVKNVVISGFHSPLEQSVLKLLIEAQSPVVVVLARPVESVRLPPGWRELLELGYMAVISVTTSTARLNGDLATERNDLVTLLANHTVVAHASIGGILESLCMQWAAQGRLVIQL